MKLFVRAKGRWDRHEASMIYLNPDQICSVIRPIDGDGRAADYYVVTMTNGMSENIYAEDGESIVQFVGFIERAT
jgi:hypothetical protein